ncbi:hypothetical protein KAT72_22115 [Aeromonas popoffii]|uniref:Uncharacterized protein n=1 Tax=Aeromonas popoffii TaxID=70856 RepID=A0ABS5GWS6_9GAMM|nr:hypothetical protein [Aeromonas popoffii]MBR7631600.1 hypothetical protein [Aeromonas popoffii]
MSYLDQEVKHEVQNLDIGKHCFFIERNEDIRDNIRLMESFFSFKNNQINWAETRNHLRFDESVFIETYKSLVLYKTILTSSNIIYINDGSLDIQIAFKGKFFSEILSYILTNITQNHYFFMPQERACLVIRSLGYVDFGYSKTGV